EEKARPLRVRRVVSLDDPNADLRRRKPRLHQRTRLRTTTFATDDALRDFLAERSSLDFAELVRPTPAGRLTAAERERREEIARLVKLARAEGAGFEPLSRVLQRPLSRVHALARHAQPKPRAENSSQRVP
ncbi:MAG TPA: hypothetical protein VFU30_11575, partial [Gaiellaceae bacterium]|nr:hypothetical protein [Gaiellaceae bacterium]